MNQSASSSSTSRHSLAPLDLAQLAKLRDQHHPHCYACTHPDHHLEFELGAPETFIGRITPSNNLCSYPDIVHGGIISLLIDEAMTCCLMAHGILGMTAELTLRYQQSVELNQELEIHTRVTRCRPPLYQVNSQLKQNGEVRVTAHAKFMQKKSIAASPDQTRI